ncbi:MAG: tetratricopeptide repeat protein [Vulcanimicrobiota bacterium]
MRDQLRKAETLFEQGRWQQALEIYQEQLAEFPEDAHSYVMAARCFVELKLFGKASEYVESAISVSPDYSYGYYCQSHIYYLRNLDQEARRAIDTALELDPTIADYHVMLARILAKKSDWKAVSERADAALGFDPTHADALVVKAEALLGLGQYEQARALLQLVLEKDPEDEVALARLGQLHLHRGEWEQALGIFQSTLAINPESEYARRGFMEALRARYPIYGIILRYFMWMSRFSRKHQQIMQYGLSVLMRYVGKLKQQYPALAPVLGVILFLWKIFAYLSWTIRAGTTMLLRLNKFGRRLVNRDEIIESNLVGGLWLAALGCWLYHQFFDPFTIFCRVGIGIFLTLPVLVGGAFSSPDYGWPMYAARAILGFMGFCGVAGLFLYTFGFNEGLTLLKIYIAGFGFAALALTYLEGVEPERE